MSTDRSREEEIFLAAIDLPDGEQRSSYVDGACAGDPRLREGVLRLLAADEDTQGLPPVHPIDSGIGILTNIGPYRLLEPLGEGGMGTVYRAEQREPVRRSVALKVIKCGMDTKAVIARFEAERQALALMDHPFVAKVFDAGATPEGRPYFVMEYVAGEPITTYCDRHRLGMVDRLRLFQGVCDAVQHAHQKGLIHRDLKPSNILVEVRESKPFPKVIDFGVAKSTQQRLTDKTVFTELGQIIGTPEYMSPEQIEMTGTDVDTRTDVYSLGVILYELLVGVLPFDGKTLRAADQQEIRRIIREVDPPRPSTRLRSLGSGSTDSAHARDSSPGTLTRRLRADLDWVVMKCLEKDRTRRYASASELSADIDRFIAHEPVLAGPPGASYRLRKFVRRNRAWVTGVVIVVLGLSGGIAAASYGLIQESRRAQELQLVAEFQAEQLAGIDVEHMGERLHERLRANVRTSLTRVDRSSEEVEQGIATLDALLEEADFTGLALTALDENIFVRALDAIEKQFSDQPLVQSKLFYTLAHSARELGLLERALQPQARALEIRRKWLGSDHLDTLKSVNEMALVLNALGKYREAEPYFAETLEMSRRISGDEHRNTLVAISHYGDFLKQQGKLAEAEPYYRRALEVGRRVLGVEDPETLIYLSNMGTLLRNRGRLEEAETCYREALTVQRRVLGDSHPSTLSSLHKMGIVLREQGKLDEAEQYYREALTQRSRVLGDRHTHTQNTLNDLGLVLIDQGKYSEAEPYLREVVEVSRAVLGDAHDDTLTSVNNLGLLLRRMKRFPEAEACFREALDGTRRLLGDEHPNTIATTGNLGAVLRDLGRLDEAEALGAEAVRLSRKIYDPRHWDVGVALSAHGQTLVVMKRYARAAVELEEAYSILSEALGASHNRTRDVLGQLVSCHKAWQRVEPNAGHDLKAAEWQELLDAAVSPSAP